MPNVQIESRRPDLRLVDGARPLRLTGSQREVLELLHEYRYLTPALLATAYGSRHGGRGYWHLQRELRRLHLAGLVQRFPGSTRARRNGSDERVYCLTHQGGRAILDALEYTATRREIYGRESKYRGNYAHHVAIAALRMILTLGQTGWRLAEFREEDRDPSACVKARLKDRQLVAWPDASALVVGDEKGKGPSLPMRFLFEIDLSRRSNQRVADRFLAYAAHLRERGAQRQPSSQRAGECSTVVFVVVGEGEVERYLRIANEALGQGGFGRSTRFKFWNMEDWFVSGDKPAVRVPGPVKLPKPHPGARLKATMLLLWRKKLSTLDGSPVELIDGCMG